MRTLKQFVIPVVLLLAILSISGCVDALEPAGPAGYVNPEYPSELLGYASIPTEFTGAYYYQNRLYILDKADEMIISFSISDPALSEPENPVQKDTLDLGFDPGVSCFDRSTGTLFISENGTNDIYRLPLSGSVPPELLYQSESIITDLFPVNSGSSLLICFLGPEWMVRKINSVTGQMEKEYLTQWPIGRAALSVNGERLLVNNSAKKYIIEIDTDSFQKVDSIAMPERVGPFIYNTSGDIIVFNQYTIHPRVYLVDGETKSIKDVLECVNTYKYCSLMPGTDVIIAPRRSDNRVSILSSDNMIFAPSIFSITYAEMAFSSQDNYYIFALSDSPGTAYVYEHSQ